MEMLTGMNQSLTTYDLGGKGGEKNCMSKIPRCFKPKDFGEVKTVELHHFSDASQSGYGQ